MAVKIRLAKRGRRKLALYDIVVANQKSPRDGRFIEKLGNYNPNTSPATIVLHEDKVVQWLFNGAQPTDTVKSILSSQGILLKKHLQMGVNKGAITQEEADKKLLAWKDSKSQSIIKFKLAAPNTFKIVTKEVTLGAPMLKKEESKDLEIASYTISNNEDVIPDSLQENIVSEASEVEFNSLFQEQEARDEVNNENKVEFNSLFQEQEARDEVNNENKV